jgi:hypothetical protein
MTNLFDQIGVQLKKKAVMNIDLMYLSHYVQSCEMCVRECVCLCLCQQTQCQGREHSAYQELHNTTEYPLSYVVFKTLFLLLLFWMVYLKPENQVLNGIV